MKKELIQHIIFPDDSSLEFCRDLFYRGDSGHLTELGSSGYLMLGRGQRLEFNTYLNGVSWKKWKKYTFIEGLTLTLDLKGDAEIVLAGYKMIGKAPEREVLHRVIINAAERQQIELQFPSGVNMDEQTIVGFEVSVISDFDFHGGYYTGIFPDNSSRDIELALLTTTFKREDYIRKNMRRLKDGLIDTYPEVGKHIRMHVVDNGRTLKQEDLPDDTIHFELHPNPNAGGSGGYARGMIECLHQTPEATHGLLMDDDIMILPESIYRTYQLLRFMRPEYHTAMIGGAMLLLEDKVMQHEDTGRVLFNGYWGGIKPKFNHAILWDNLKNEDDYPKKDIYQAWWYCCIPVTVIKKNGLPLPLFIRGDDVEYGLRCKEKIITMNGICLWHMGFDGKYSPTLNVYQEIRNLLIDQAASDILPTIDISTRVKHSYLHSILKHDYVTAELMLRAFEDYMKGPDFIMENRGEQIIKDNNTTLDKMLTFEELGIEDIDVNPNLYNDEHNGLFIRLWRRITWNGHFLWPERWLNKKITILPRDLGHFPGKTTNKKTIIAIDGWNKKACVWELDKERFMKLQKRFFRDMLHYKNHKSEIRKAYQDKSDYLKSEEFWRKYLKMEKITQ